MHAAFGGLTWSVTFTLCLCAFLDATPHRTSLSLPHLLINLLHECLADCRSHSMSARTLRRNDGTKAISLCINCMCTKSLYAFICNRVCVVLQQWGMKTVVISKCTTAIKQTINSKLQWCSVSYTDISHLYHFRLKQEFSLDGVVFTFHKRTFSDRSRAKILSNLNPVSSADIPLYFLFLSNIRLITNLAINVSDQM